MEILNAGPSVSNIVTDSANLTTSKSYTALDTSNSPLIITFVTPLSSSSLNICCEALNKLPSLYEISKKSFITIEKSLLTVLYWLEPLFWYIGPSKFIPFATCKENS